MAKETLTAAILERLTESAWEIEALIELLLTAPYGTSLGGLEYRLGKIRSRNERLRMQAVRRKQIQTTIAKLRRQGIVSGEKKRSLRLTVKGRRKWEKILIRRARPPLPSPRYDSLPSGNLILITFDISEKENYKRRWLCSALHSMGLRRLQQSVFVGLRTLPPQFTQDLVTLRLDHAVEIIAVTRPGTLPAQ